MTALPAHTSVLIVGAGPAGLATATTLAQAGVDFLLIDRLGEAQNTSRAAVVHARTLEVLEELRVTETLLREGLKIPTFTLRDGQHTLARITFDDLPTRYPFTLMAPQSMTEAALLARLRELGGDVHRPYTLTGLTSTNEGVTATVTDAEGTTHEITADYAVGTDGMHSVVREQAGIGFAGDQYPGSFVLADVRMRWPLGRDEVRLSLSADGLTLVAPLPDDRFRIVATVAEAAEHPSLADVQAILDARGPRGRIEVTEVVWSSRFHVHHRLAQRYRAGRVLLAGDAAHVHSPAGGQGMNTGIQDGVALGHALATALTSGEDAALDDYERTRRPIAQRVVEFTDRTTRLATLTSPVARAARNTIVPLVTRIPPVRRRIAYELAELANR